MIITFWDKTTIVVSRDQWQQIKTLRDEGRTWIELPSIELEFDPRTIAKVTRGGQVAIPVDRRIAAPKVKRASRSTVDSTRAILEKRGIIKPKIGAAA